MNAWLANTLVRVFADLQLRNLQAGAIAFLACLFVHALATPASVGLCMRIQFRDSAPDAPTRRPLSASRRQSC